MKTSPDRFNAPRRFLIMASLHKRKNAYYAQYYVGGQQRRVSLKTTNYQLAKEKLRQMESALARGDDGAGLPTRTPIAQVIQAYVEHIRTVKTAKSAQTDAYYLRDAFGPVCPGLQVNSRKQSPKARKRPLLPGATQDRRRRPQVIEANCFEEITTAQVAAFITGQVQSRGLAPKTANRYREILCRLFNWSTTQLGIRLSGSGRNPAAGVERYRERAPEIRYLTLPQIDEQLFALRFKPQMQTMVAVLIYAGLRREELLWLTLDDIDLKRGNSGGYSGGHGLIRIRAKTIQTPAGPRAWQPKTRTNRAVPISSTLRQYLDRYTPPATTWPDRDDQFPGWYFPSPQGSLWDPDNFSQDLRTANQDARLVWSSLDYRHTFGSQLAQNGVSLYKIATMMGNSPEICRRHYAALVPEAMAGDVEFICHKKINTSIL